MTHGRGFQDGPVSRRSISLSRTLRSPSLAGPNDDCRDLSGLPEHWSPFEYQASASGLEMVVKTDSASSSPQCFARYEIGGSRTLIEGLLSGGRSPELVPAALTRLVRRDAFEWGRTGKAPPASWSSSTGSRAGPPSSPPQWNSLQAIDGSTTFERVHGRRRSRAIGHDQELLAEYGMGGSDPEIESHQERRGWQEAAEREWEISLPHLYRIETRSVEVLFD
jgi:hypothetical protein